jgi:hypothetical protein
MSGRDRGAADTLRRLFSTARKDECEEAGTALLAEDETSYPVAYSVRRRVAPPVPSLAVRAEKAESARVYWREQCNKAMHAIAACTSFTLDTRYGRIVVDGKATLRAELMALNIFESVILYLPNGDAHHLTCVDDARVIWVHARNEKECIICRMGARQL